MMTVAAVTARAGSSQRTGKRGGSVRQLVSATTICRRPANQPSLFLAAVIFFRAIQKQLRSPATSSSRMILASHHDPYPWSITAVMVQQTPTAAVRQ